MNPKYILNDKTHQVTPIRRRDDVELDVDGKKVMARVQWLTGHECQLTIDGVTRQVFAAQDDDKLFVHLDGRVFELDVVDEFSSEGSGAGAAGGGLVKAPMPGVVIEVSVEPGQPVVEGQTLMLIESMKLQMEIKSNTTGVVGRLGVDVAGASFDKGSVLAEVIVESAVEGESEQ